ncbi:M23 family metallopeptidase [Nanchangia anserum]|uniref:M23 family metallopeptidase n=2 Tax=Nanchangia anserum TaxID=2692125 RepID=A0A8I0KR15_9ACTO|nr:M23 family metallopeptidase [Nanchangia anserum]QOX82620.1 M23 family metallopeptidase [Nanchangia anserum]
MLSSILGASLALGASVLSPAAAPLPLPPASAPVAEASVSTSGRLAPTQRWLWPSGHPVAVVRGFAPPAKRWLAGHRGVDLAIPPGTTLYAPADGTIAHAGEVAGTSVVSIDHADGVRSTFQPVRPLVSAGDVVRRGAPIGTLLSGHDADALHLGARRGRDTYLNPLRLLMGPIVLKPWEN